MPACGRARREEGGQLLPPGAAPGDTPAAGCPLPGRPPFFGTPSLLRSFISPGAAAAERCGPVLRRRGWTVGH